MLALEARVVGAVDVDADAAELVANVARARRLVSVAVELLQRGGNLGERATTAAGCARARVRIAEGVPQLVEELRVGHLEVVVDKIADVRVDEELRRHYPRELADIGVRVAIGMERIRKERRVGRARAVGFLGRQRRATVAAQVAAGELRTGVGRQLRRHGVVEAVVLAVVVERRCLASRVVGREHDGPVGLDQLRTITEVEPGLVAEDRPAEVENRIDAVRGIARRGGVFGDGLIGGIQTNRRTDCARPIVVPVVDAGAAMVDVAAGLRDGADDTARRGAILGVVAARLHLDFLKEVDQHGLGGDAGAQVRRVHAVDDVAVLGARRAVDRETRLRFLVGARSRRQDAREVTAARDALDELRLDRETGRILLDVDDGRFRRHLDVFGDAADRHRDIDFQDLSQLQLDVRDFMSLEPGKNGSHFIIAGSQRGEPIDSLCVCHQRSPRQPMRRYALQRSRRAVLRRTYP